MANGTQDPSSKKDLFAQDPLVGGEKEEEKD